MKFSLKHQNIHGGIKKGWHKQFKIGGWHKEGGIKKIRGGIKQGGIQI